MAPFQFVMRTGPTPGKTFYLEDAEITIGRDISNQVVINDAEISRRHAHLIAQTNGYLLEDLGSTNGTFVNNQRLMGPHMLRPGELVAFGENVTLAFEQVNYDRDATQVAASNVPNLPPAPRPQPAPPAYAPPPVYQAPQYAEPEPPSYAPAPPAYTPPQAAYAAYEGDYPEERKPARTWWYVGCGCLVVGLVALIVAGFAFDYLNLYCTPPFNMIFGCP
jgi:hypothetical protein